MHVDEMCLHTKYEHCDLNSMEVKGKCSQVKFSADRQTDRRTLVNQYAPNLSMRGHKNFGLVQIESICRRHVNHRAQNKPVTHFCPRNITQTMELS